MRVRAPVTLGMLRVAGAVAALVLLAGAQAPGHNSAAPGDPGDAGPAELPRGAILRLGGTGDRDTGPQSLRGVLLSADGRLLATRDEPGDPTLPRAVRLWDTATGKLLHALTGHGRPIADFALSPDGRTLVSTDFDAAEQAGVTRVWDAATGALRHVIPEGGPAVRFSRDGATFALVVRDQVRVHRAATGEEVLRFSGPNVIVDLSRDGRRVLGRSFERDPVVRLVDVAAGRDVARFTELGALPRTIVLSPDGRTLAAPAPDGNAILLCEVETAAVVHRLEGHGQRVFAIAFSLDGRFLASGGADRSVRLWEVATGRELYRADGHAGLVTAVAFSSDGDRLVSGGTDRTVLVWDLLGKARSTVPAGPLDESAIEDVWHELAAPEPARAYLAIARVVTARESGLPRLHEKLLSLLSPAHDERLERLLRDLAHADSRVRQRATRELRKLRQVARPVLERLLAETDSPEVRKRVLRILGGSSETPRFTPGDERRMVRVLAALEQIGGADAEDAVALIAREFPPGRIAGEARATLERMRSQ